MAGSVRRGAASVVRRRAGERPAERRPARKPERLAPGGRAEVQVEEIQRSRLLVAAVAVIDEQGYPGTSVAQITARAQVSRRTFYELFDNREACLVALLDDVVLRVEQELAAAGLEGLPWRERVRGGLWVILSFLERERGLAQICVVQSARGGAPALERRERILTRLAGVLDQGRGEGPRGRECTLVTAEGLVGGALGVVYARLRGGDSRPLTGLLEELMGMIALQYLGSRAARREQQRPAPALREAPKDRWEVSARRERDPLDEVDMRLTYRTARVLEGARENPGASNRRIADHAGITDPGQVSKLLRRLERLGLLENEGLGHAQGEPNKWQLTSLGRQVAQRLSVVALDRNAAA